MSASYIRGGSIEDALDQDDELTLIKNELIDQASVDINNMSDFIIDKNFEDSENPTTGNQAYWYWRSVPENSGLLGVHNGEGNLAYLERMDVNMRQKILTRRLFDNSK